MPDDEMDKFLDDALGQLSGIMGQMGYAMCEPMPGALEIPSGELLVCDIAALPPARMPVGRIVFEGEARGAVFRAPESVIPAVRDAHPGQVNDVLLVARQVPAVRERTRVATAPITGIFLVGDATLLEGIKRSPRRVPRAPEGETFGAIETATRVARERGAKLGPTAMALLLHSARTGMWRGVLHGRDALAVSLGHRHTLRIREGVDAKVQRTYLRIDSLRDAVMADPRLRAMAKREATR